MALQITPPPPRNLAPIDAKGLFVQPWSGWFRNLTNFFFERGFTGTITTAPTTSGGTAGQMVFQNGVLVGQTPAT